MMSRLVFLCAMLACASAFAPSLRLSSRTNGVMKMSVFDDGVKKFAADYPAVYARGWGPTSKAER